MVSPLRKVAVLLSYRRPQLTHSALEALLHREEIDQVIVSIDGERSAADDFERDARLRTVKVCEDFAEREPRVKINVRSRNSGLNEHVIQALSLGFEETNDLIFLEEDIRLTDEGYHHLLLVQGSSFEPQIAAAHALHSHKGTAPNAVRRTFFPQQWGLGLNRAFFEMFLETAARVKVEPHELKRSIDLSLSKASTTVKDNVARYWARLYTGALQSENHTDAILQATSMINLVPYLAPWQSLVEDLGGLDSGGMNPRPIKKPRQRHHLASIANDFCQKCELSYSRKGVASRSYLIYERLYGMWSRSSFYKSRSSLYK